MINVLDIIFDINLVQHLSKTGVDTPHLILSSGQFLHQNEVISSHRDIVNKEETQSEEKRARRCQRIFEPKKRHSKYTFVL